MEVSTLEQRSNQVVGTRQRVRHGQGLLTPMHGLVRIAQIPQDPGPEGTAAYPQVLRLPPGGSVWGCVLLEVGEGNPPLHVGAGGGKGAYLVQALPQHVVGPQEQGGVTL